MPIDSFETLSCVFELKLEPQYLAEELFGMLKDVVVVFGCGSIHRRQFGCREEKGCECLLRVG